MTKELQEKLFTKYDKMFRDRSKPMSETCMCWGCSCDDGWYHILDHMCAQLEHLREEYDVVVIFDQIKEKFGTLRIYHHEEYGDRWTKEGEWKDWKIDDKSEIEYSSLGWRHSGKMVSAAQHVSDQIEEVIRVTDMMSHITCEKCGMTGATQTEGGWITTLCDNCKQKKV